MTRWPYPKRFLLFREGGKRETGPQPRIRPYRTPGKGHRARGELTRPRRASTSSPRARCEARARAFRVFPVAIFRKSAHLPVLKTVSYTISRRKVISERRKVVIIIGLSRARLTRKLVFCFQSVFPRLDPCGEVKIRPNRFRPPYRISNQPSSRSMPRARIDAVRIDDCAARVFENTRRSAWCRSRLCAVAPPVGTRRE